MKKKLLLGLIVLLLPTLAFGGPFFASGGGAGTSTASDCSTYTAIGQLCQDLDDGKLYKGTGAGVLEIAAGASGDVVSTSASQTWGDGTGPVVWTFSVTGTDPTISVATGAFTLNTDLALGANDITMTGSLGATGAGKLTKIWSVDAEFTNAPTVNGAAFKPADLAIASQAAGDILYFNGTNWVRLAKDAGKYLKSGDSAVSWDTPAGSGTVDVSGTPANHYWPGWTDADTLKGFSITASKPVCSDANGDPAVCAGTEGVWQAAGSYQTLDADLTTIAGLTVAEGKVIIGNSSPAWSASAFTLAAPSTSGNILKSDGTNWTSSNSLSLATLDMTSATSSIPWTVAADCSAVVDEGKACWDSDDNVLYIGNTTTQTATAKVSGALGTPSFTALNMPSSDADPGTTAGQIRHDSSDTAASAAGNAKFYDGTNVRTIVSTGAAYTLITKYEYLPIRYAEDDVSVAAPAAAAEIGTTSLIGRSFAEDADNGVIFFWQIPSDYVSGIKYRVFYALNANGQADETAAFSLAGCSVGNSDALACSEGTAVVVTDELGTDDDTGELLVTGWSTAVTITNAAAGEMASLLLIRDVSEDDYSDHLLVSGIEIKYVSKLAPFSDY